MFGDDVRLIRLSEEHEIKPFDCGDSDLNEFLQQDAKKYLRELLAVTYLVENDTDTIAFFSVSNDKIAYVDLPSNSQWNKFRKRFDRAKHIKSYPSVKIGRLGVSAKFQGNNYGNLLLDYIKLLFVKKNKTGCRFITLDAYNKPPVLRFYERNGFEYLPDANPAPNADTKLMYFDLAPLSAVVAEEEKATAGELEGNADDLQDQ